MVERSGGIGLQLTFVLIALIAAVLYSGKAQFVLNRVNQIIQGKRGCSPIQDIGHVTLHYFGVRGRAEGIRFMLEDNSIPYAETAYTKADWPAVKKKGIETGLFTFGQGKSQSGNVAKFTEEYFNYTVEYHKVSGYQIFTSIMLQFVVACSSYKIDP